MNEKLLSYIWQQKLFNANELKTQCGKYLKLLSVGTLNTISGPDFQLARIKLDETEWVGAVELHVNASDWFKHNHQNDKAYDNVILHVVYNDDIGLSIKNIPVLQLKGLIQKQVIERYSKLKTKTKSLPCESFTTEIDSITIQFWFDRLLVERLENKTKRLSLWLKNTNGDWNQLAYKSLCRAFGQKYNSDAFELLADNLPYKILQKHADNSFQTLSLLLGVSGLIYKSGDFNLLKEFEYLNKKYKLNCMEPHQWKFGGLRPPNFPTVRLRQLNTLISAKTVFSLFYDVAEKLNSPKYNPKEFILHTDSKYTEALSQGIFESIVVNAIAPLMFLFSKENNDEDLNEKALLLLHSLRFEKNKLVDRYNFLNLNFNSAAKSQALYELNQSYCSKLACLNCAIGNKILRKNDYDR